jgi:hypothetical protein
MSRFIALFLVACAGATGGADTSDPPPSVTSGQIPYSPDTGPPDTADPSFVGSGTMGLTCAEVGCADTEYCVSSYGPTSANTELSNAECAPLPAACATDATCACLIAEGACAVCADDADSGRPWCTG